MTNKKNSATAKFERIILDDEDLHGLPDQWNCGFWPSQDPDMAGYVGPNVSDEDFEHMYNKAQERMDAFKRGDWCHVIVKARAIIEIVRNGFYTQFVEIESDGYGGVEGDSGDKYMNEIFEKEKAELIEDLKVFTDLAFPDESK